MARRPLETIGLMLRGHLSFTKRFALSIVYIEMPIEL